MTIKDPSYTDKIELPVTLSVIDWSLVLMALGRLEREFNGMEEDGLNLSELSSDLQVKIKTRVHDATRGLC